MSRIGKQPITVPPEAKVALDGRLVTVEGPKGRLAYHLPEGISIEINDSEIVVKRASDAKQHRAFHGLARALINNMVQGVVKEFRRDMRLEGTGYRLELQGNYLSVSVGYSHPIMFGIPEGIRVEVNPPKTNPPLQEFSVVGCDKQLVGEVASRIRALRPPEPYRGKGIRYVDEYVRRKAGKTVGT